MKEIFNKLINSFDNNTSGFSARKLTAFSLMICIAYIHLKFIDTTNSIEALVIDLCGVLIVLGIVTAEQVIKLKNGNNENNESK